MSWEAFKDSQPTPTLSFTLQNSELRTPAGLKQFQRDKAIPSSGDLPGICMLTYADLTDEKINLPPRRDRDRDDEKYGHLHCCTDRPRHQLQMERMADLATKNGVLCDMVRHKKRKRDAGQSRDSGE